MVTITGYEKRENDKGEFFLLQLEGDVEFAYSKKTGMPYATVKKCSIPCTFDERTCKTSIGKQMKGSITKVQVEQYDYTVPETGEVIQLDYRYTYSPEEEANMEKTVFGEQTEA